MKIIPINFPIRAGEFLKTKKFRTHGFVLEKKLFKSTNIKDDQKDFLPPNSNISFWSLVCIYITIMKK